MHCRINKLRHFMENKSLDAVLITKAENIRYLSGFTGGKDGRLLLTAHKQVVITDPRYLEQTAQECPEWELYLDKNPREPGWFHLAPPHGRIGIEAHDITFQNYQLLRQHWGEKIVPLTGMVEEFRIIKDEGELELLRRAARINDAVYDKIIRQVEKGWAEEEIARHIGYYLRELGCDREAFDIIALAGENGALPHGRPGTRRLARGDCLTLDFGGMYQGYAGDMTRTLFVETADARGREYYARVLEAQELALRIIRADIPAREVDARAREYLRRYELDSYFVHGLGHGIGLEVHEEPRLSAFSEIILQENMVVTVEPGIYLPGWGGIRIEDMVVVTPGGCEILTRSAKELRII